MAEEETVVETQTTEEQEGSEPSQEKPKRTKAEIAAFNLKKHADEAKALGLDPATVIGITPKAPVTESDDDKPVTVGMLKSMQREGATKTALELAAGIQDEDTRSLVTTYLNENIMPSGDAEKDFRIALAAAAAPKNKQVLEEINRYGTPKKAAAGGSSPAKAEAEFEATPAERALVQGFGFPPEKQKELILKARKEAADKQG